MVGKDNIDFNSAMRMSGTELDLEAKELEISLEDENSFLVKRHRATERNTIS